MIGNIQDVGVAIPDGGNHPKFKANKIINISPSQKLGIETASKPSAVAELSKMVYCFVADKIPSGIPIMIDKIVP